MVEIRPMHLGARVQANAIIIDNDDGECVALPGDLGTVVECGQYPTVRFDRSQTATIVDPEGEVSIIAPLLVLA